MAKTPSLFLANLFLLLSCSARAEFYTCKDNAGHVISSDRPIPECADKSTQVFKANGSLKGQLAAPPTPEQRKAAEIMEQQRVREALHQEDIKREQLYLAAHYANEDAIETARKREIESVEDRIAIETRNIEAANATVNKNQRMLTNLPASQAAKIRQLKSQIDDMNQTIQESNRIIAGYKAEESKINQQFDATHKRYLEIMGPSKH